MNYPSPDGGGGRGGRMSSINITSFRALVKAMERASDDIETAIAGAETSLGRLWLSADGFGKGKTVVAWIDHEMPGLKRRLAMAEHLQQTTPGLPDNVRIDESLLLSLSPAQARKYAAQAAKLLKGGWPDPDTLGQLNNLLGTYGDDPYFAHALAMSVPPRALAAYIARVTPGGRILNGISKEDYTALLDNLAGTMSLASRGTGDLTMPPSWLDDWKDKMGYPRFDGDSDDPDAYRQHDTDLDNRGALWLLLSRGHWSTPFLQGVTKQFAAFDARGLMAGYKFGGVYTPITPDGKPFLDPMVALMGALVNNPQAAHWAFTQGGSTNVPFPKDGEGAEGPVQTFLYNLLHEHKYGDGNDEAGPQTVLLALRAAMVWKNDPRIIASAKNLQKSMRQQKEVWDEKPWYAKWGHTVLDVLGLIPLVGDPADAVNAGWYGAEGDWVNAGLSAAALIPFAGSVVGAGKLFARGSKLAETLKLVDRLGKDIDLASPLGKNLMKSIKIEDGVYQFTDMKALNAVLHSKTPNLEIRSQGLAFVTNDAGKVTELKVFVDGSWVKVDSGPLGLKLAQYKAGDSPWDLLGATRGEVIETALAKTDYKAWDHVGKTRGGFYPYIDFFKNGKGVSLKTLDPPSAANAGRIHKNIDDLAKLKSLGRAPDGRPLRTAELDVRVRIGQENADSLRRLREYAREKGVTLNVRTY